MTLLSILATLVVGLPLLLAAISWLAARLIEHRYPPNGVFASVDGIDLHYVFWPGEGEGAEQQPVLFIHGASGNLRDQMGAMEPFRGRMPMIFVDRPGHGYSGRTRNHQRPNGQARAIAALIAKIAPGGVVLVGHSFGGAVALNLAMNHPECVTGLVLLSPASHPWPGAQTSWYYRLAARPLLGRLFVWTLAVPGGFARLRGGIECVFAPNAVADVYASRAAIALAFRPCHFRANAIDVEGLYEHVTDTCGRYPSIRCPTVIITGDSDTVVYEHVHSLGCARDLPNTELFVIDNCGHKTDYVAPRVTLAAIAQVAGTALPGVEAIADEAESVETAIASDRFGEQCRLEKPEDAGDILSAAAAAKHYPVRDAALPEPSWPNRSD
ncbi:alpha/beta fold hydrolase [Notoacmeibacter ruber]|uniref:Alpha/beta hydrolase n=1 Tax=Notoacmeibacter ruber TaxID=2670375 RepID=A0A3L7JD87_9HYPH|nr:alpha/beta hydrolase [Notoacmeibacter ruber]RLQ88717.1 alpha/beta hydrolase [Notoacmeibacter ruber]